MISVIIPIYNSQNTIIDTLKGLEDQTVDDFEVIVVDDGSTDNSFNVVNRFLGETVLNIKVIQEKNSGPAEARNLGVRQSSGDIVIFLDSDCIPPSNWIEEMVKPLHGNVAGCNCRYLIKNSESFVARYIDYEITKRQEKLMDTYIDTIGAYSASFIKRIFLEVGGFDTRYRAASGEDFDLSFKLWRSGYNLFFTSKTFVYHYHPDSIKKFLKQQFSRGYWRARLYSKNKDKIIKGDSYTGFEAQTQFIISILAMVSLPLVIVNPTVPLFGISLLAISNMSIGIWSFPKERGFLVIAPVLASLRSIAGTFGVLKYCVDSVIP